MKIVPALDWHVGGSAEALDPRLMPLLEAVASSSSLASAVVGCGVSYRAAWGLLRRYETIFGEPLVRLERGRGATLTKAGERLVKAKEDATRRLGRILPGLAAEIGPARVAERAASTLELRVAASHDLALAAFAETLPAAGLRLDLLFMGSLHAIREFAEGHADIAGFHVPLAGVALDGKTFRHGLRARRDRLLRFVDRDQGLILPRRNPAQVRSFREVAAKGLRFVNRQRGSGTRLLIDRLLADAGLRENEIDGYRTEEFTHGAVAATVASGGADAGFGLRAAADEYRLAFVPLVRERYFLAVRAKALAMPATIRLIDTLASPAFRRVVKPLAGYRASAAGTVESLDAMPFSPPG